MRFSTAVIFGLAAAAFASPTPQTDTAAAAKAPRPCPETFLVYLGPGNDSRNRTWYVSDLAVGRGTQLGASSPYATEYKLEGRNLVWASDNGVVLHAFKSDFNGLVPVDDAWKKQYPDRARDLVPVTVTINPSSCILSLRGPGGKRYLQRFGFYLNLTPTPTGGQIQWPSPTAVKVPPAAQA